MLPLTHCTGITTRVYVRVLAVLGARQASIDRSRPAADLIFGSTEAPGRPVFVPGTGKGPFLGHGRKACDPFRRFPDRTRENQPDKTPADADADPDPNPRFIAGLHRDYWSARVRSKGS